MGRPCFHFSYHGVCCTVFIADGCVGLGHQPVSWHFFGFCFLLFWGKLHSSFWKQKAHSVTLILSNRTFNSCVLLLPWCSSQGHEGMERYIISILADRLDESGQAEFWTCQGWKTSLDFNYYKKLLLSLKPDKPPTLLWRGKKVYLFALILLTSHVSCTLLFIDLTPWVIFCTSLTPFCSLWPVLLRFLSHLFVWFCILEEQVIGLFSFFPIV